VRFDHIRQGGQAYAGEVELDAAQPMGGYRLKRFRERRARKGFGENSEQHIKNTKHQAPNTKEASNSKLQSNRFRVLVGRWSLKFGVGSY
jgi:hypothetical protein